VGRLLDEVDRAYSRFRPDSELSQINDDGGRTRRISPLLADAIATSLQAAVLTGDSGLWGTTPTWWPTRQWSERMRAVFTLPTSTARPPSRSSTASGTGPRSRPRKSKRAARLLRETDATVAEVGSRVAYTSEFAFNRAFCRYHGISPGRYRSRAQASSTPGMNGQAPAPQGSLTTNNHFPSV